MKAIVQQMRMAVIHRVFITNKVERLLNGVDALLAGIYSECGCWFTV